MTKTPTAFATWFNTQARLLLRATPASAAAEIVVQLSAIDARMAVEVGEDDPRELILSAGGEKSLFDAVDEVAALVGAPCGWQVRALKPPRGFDFELELDGSKLAVADVLFDPLEAPGHPGEVAIVLIVQPELVEAVRQAAPIILETGLGERLAATIDFVDARGRTKADSVALSIHELAEFLAWKQRQRE